MPVQLSAAPAKRDTPASSRLLRVGLINNMPDTALQATERHFTSLLEAAAGDLVVDLSLFALPGVPRSESSRRHIQRLYCSYDSIFDAGLDALIVTGAEPRAASLDAEPYWQSLTQVIDWAEHNTRSTVWSCLAAHAVVLHLDGIQRRRLADKRFGVFGLEAAVPHALIAGIAPPLAVPHSRWNDIAEKDLTDHGYSILMRAADGSVDSFVRRGSSLFVFFQGHPEYEADTLLREYRRDIGRYLKAECDRYPGMPQGYFDPETQEVLERFRDRAQSNRGGESIGNFPTARVSKRVTTTWRPLATQIYRNWLAHLADRSETSRKEKAPRIRPQGEQGFSLSEAALSHSRFH